MTKPEQIQNGSPVIETTTSQWVTFSGTVIGYDATTDRYRICYDPSEGISTPKWVKANLVKIDA